LFSLHQTPIVGQKKHLIYEFRSQKLQLDVVNVDVNMDVDVDVDVDAT